MTYTVYSSLWRRQSVVFAHFRSHAQVYRAHDNVNRNTRSIFKRVMYTLEQAMEFLQEAPNRNPKSGLVSLFFFTIPRVQQSNFTIGITFFFFVSLQCEIHFLERTTELRVPRTFSLLSQPLKHRVTPLLYFLRTQSDYEIQFYDSQQITRSRQFVQFVD